jgi:hypothetical protein
MLVTLSLGVFVLISCCLYMILLTVGVAWAVLPPPPPLSRLVVAYGVSTICSAALCLTGLQDYTGNMLQPPLLQRASSCLAAAALCRESSAGAWCRRNRHRGGTRCACAALHPQCAHQHYAAAP